MPKKRKPPKAGPSRNRAYIQVQIDAARAIALTADELPALLVRLRDGDTLASTELQEKLAYLIYVGRSGPLDAWDIQEETINWRASAIATCVKRLATNDVNAFSDVVKFVKD